MNSIPIHCPTNQYKTRAISENLYFMELSGSIYGK